MDRARNRRRSWKPCGALLIAALVLGGSAAAQDLETWRERYAGAENDEQRAVAIEAFGVIAEETQDAEVRVEALKATIDATLEGGLLARTTATDALKASSHRRLVLEELYDAARAHAREMDGLQREQARKSGKFDPRPSKKAVASPFPSPETLAKMSMMDWSSSATMLSSFFADLFLDLPADRSVEALTLLLPHMPLAPRSNPALDALLEFGSGPALESSLSMLERIEEERERLEDEVRRCERTRIGRRPKTYKASQEAWEERERARLDALIAIREERMRELDGWLEACVDRWRRFAGTHGLPEPPPEAFPSRTWTRWGDKVAQSLPASLDEEPDVPGEAGGEGG